MARKNEEVSLYHKYRPETLAYVHGQPLAIKEIKSWFQQEKVPHAIIFHGPSGTGKTTLANIVAQRLGCSRHNTKEINCGTDGGVAMVRDLEDKAGLPPLGSESRAWILDEAQSITGTGQNALLTVLEKSQPWDYYIICTTDPDKLITTVKSRCTKVQLHALSAQDLATILDEVLEHEQVAVDDAVRMQLVNAAQGSARQLLVSLDKVLKLPDVVDQLSVIEYPEIAKAAYDLMKALVYRESGRSVCAEILRDIMTQEKASAEEIRNKLLASCLTEWFKGNDNQERAFRCMDRLIGYIPTGKAGFAFLARSIHQLTAEITENFEQHPRRFVDNK